jgi:hypothetical protein
VTTERRSRSDCINPACPPSATLHTHFIPSTADSTLSASSWQCLSSDNQREQSNGTSITPDHLVLHLQEQWHPHQHQKNSNGSSSFPIMRAHYQKGWRSGRESQSPAHSSISPPLPLTLHHYHSLSHSFVSTNLPPFFFPLQLISYSSQSLNLSISESH